jgi:hypothetical protein
MMPAKTDLGIGGISGSLLDAPGFLDVFSDDNRGGFTLNWGKDTTSANIPVSYTNLEGEVVYETWGYNALVTALVEKVYVRDGVEQESWTTPEALIAAYLDMSGQELESTADGSALAEVFEGKTLTEVAEELGADSVVAFTAVAVSGRNYLFVLEETFGEYTLYKQESLITSAEEAIVAYLEESYADVVVTATLLDDAGVAGNAYLQGLFDETDAEGNVTLDVNPTTVAEVLALLEETDPNAELYATTWSLTYGGTPYSGEDAFLLLNINGYFVVVSWL